MRHRKAGLKLSRKTGHLNSMFRNLVTSLLKHDRIRTTDTKAKELRRWADHLITLAKRGDLHARRRALTVLRSNKEAAHVLFNEIAPLVAEREGGYTRITKVGNRKGDNAPMAVIELVREPVAKKATVKEAEAATKRAAKDSKQADSKMAETKKADDAAEVEELTLDDHATEEAATAPAGALELPEGAVASNEDGSAPEGYEVKGNANSGLYHVPGSQWYDATEAEFWFASAEDAEKAGFKPAGGAEKQQVEDDA